MSAVVDDEIVFLNPGTNSYVAIDRVGRQIWELLESPRRLDDLVAALAAEYDTEPTVIGADVAAVLDELEREGTVHAVRPPVAP
ncbi:MAG: PqqD family protein [Solirubrobacteraceae bacterium]|jgi:hypothetical protein